MTPPGIKVLAAMLALFASSPAWASNFQAAATSDLSPYSPHGAAFGVFSTSGRQDIAVTIADGSNYVRVMHGDGTGALPSSVDLPAAAGPASVVAADFNGDGETDLAVSNTVADSVSVFLNNGDGTFLPRVDYTKTNSMVGTAPTAIAVGDFRGDGIRDDLAVINSTDNTVAILLNDGTGNMTTQPLNWPSSAAITAIAVGDLNGDDIDDLALARNSVGLVTVFRGNGVGTFLPGTDITLGNGLAALVAVDFNNDGMADLAVLNSTAATISIIRGNGSAVFSVNSTYDVTSPADNTANPVDIIAVDLSRDGILDLAVANNARNSLSVLTGKGDATFAPATGADTFSTGAAPTTIGSGDLNGSGNDLLSLSNTTSSYSLLLNISPEAAGITVTPATYDFSNFRVGHLPYISKQLTIANGGSAQLTVSSMTISGVNNDDFQVLPQYGTCATSAPTIAAGSSCTMELRFLPITVGVKTASLDIASNAANNPLITMPLSGTVVPYNSQLTLNLAFIGRGSGTVSFSSGDPDCAANCSRTPTSASVNLIPSPATDMFFYGWSGCDTVSSGACMVTLTSAKSITANFGPLTRQVKLDASWPIYTATVAEAYTSSITGNEIKLSRALLNEHVILNRPVEITLTGGYNNDFTVQGEPTVLRSMTVAAGSAVVDNIILH